MIGVVNDVLTGFDNDQCTVMLFLDLSAAFDTIDIDILLDILENEIGVTGVALRWFESFMKGRTQKVRIGSEFSKILEVLFGTPQGSVIIILFHPKTLHDSVLIRGTFIGEQCIRFSTEVKNVGVVLDENLTMTSHVNKIVSHCYKLLKDIGKIRKVLSDKHTEMLVHSVISSRIDYCNGLFFNMSKKNINKLQKVQNAAARLVAGKRKRDSILH